MPTVDMLSQEELESQQQLLATYRRTLAHLVHQAAQYGGEVYAPPHVANGIHEARDAIRQIKATLRELGVSVADLPDDKPPAPGLSTSRPSSSELRNRSRMLEKVRAFWIKGVLENSLHGAALIELGLEEHPDAVAHPWDMLVQQPDRPASPLPPGTTITEVFDDLCGDLLILGAPGSGKTTLLLELARDLLVRAEQDDAHAIPVVFNLSSWVEKRPPLAAWLVDELSSRYDVPRRIGKAWVEAEQVLPLLDGLDEVKQQHRAACVEAINSFRHQHGLVKLVVCSRVADYQELAVRLKLLSAVLVQPLSQQQIDTYIESAGEQLAALRAALAEGGALRELAESPLLLSVMTLAYRNAPAELLPTLETAEEQCKYLFAAYVDQMFERRGASTRYSRRQTIGWLAWLAQALSRQSQSVFFIERLQPDWLPTRALRWQYTLVDRLGGGLIIGLLVGLTVGLVYGAVHGLAYVLSMGLISGLFGGVFGGQAKRYLPSGRISFD